MLEKNKIFSSLRPSRNDIKHSIQKEQYPRKLLQLTMSTGVGIGTSNKTSRQLIRLINAKSGVKNGFILHSPRTLSFIPYGYIIDETKVY